MNKQPHSRTKDWLAKTASGTTSDQNIDLSFQGVEFDSRKIVTDNLFVAYQGDNAHGHQFLDSAFSKGAALAIVEDKETYESSPHKDQLILVSDSVKALNDVAAAIRIECPTPTLAITGSMGKTTTKEIAKSILLAHSEGSASIASYNNHIGVAYTICNSSPEDNWLILEMGMNHAGELEQLSAVGIPDVAVITTIAPVHMEFFNSIDDIARAKLEILSGVKENGAVILNADDPVLQKNFQEWQTNNKEEFSVKMFGEGDTAELQIISSSFCGLDGYKAEYKYQNQTSPYQLNSLGAHNVFNSAAAILACTSLIPDISHESIVEGLKAFEPEKHRLSVVRLSDGRKILDDSYNANPTATMKALDLLADLRKEEETIAAVLGDMTEIGEFSAQEHQKVAEHLVKIKPKFLITVGHESKLMSDYAQAKGINTRHFSSPEEAGEYVTSQDFSILLVKASRTTGLDRCVEKIRELA